MVAGPAPAVKSRTSVRPQPVLTSPGPPVTLSTMAETDEFRFSCPNGHSFISSNRIRAFCPECGTSVRRVASTPEQSPAKPAKPKTLTVKKIVHKQAPQPQKEEPLPTSKTTRKPPSKATQKPRNAPAKPPSRTTTKSKSAPTKILAQKRVASKSAPRVATKIPRTTKQSTKTADQETMYTRVRRLAFGR